MENILPSKKVENPINFTEINFLKTHIYFSVLVQLVSALSPFLLNRAIAHVVMDYVSAVPISYRSPTCAERKITIKIDK